MRSALFQVSLSQEDLNKLGCFSEAKYLETTNSYDDKLHMLKLIHLPVRGEKRGVNWAGYSLHGKQVKFLMN